MDCKDILRKATKYNGDKNLCIDTNRINIIELKFLEQNGYKIKLFNQSYLKKPYYQISQKASI
ncbi:TPA: hypothetical protein ACXDAY_002295 [Clostridium botulinum]|uniref:hypothetical protein n=1 Tax=Clostridium botulinum TaxID=1491 RepID=UPI000464E31A|nr:hypothetical protein [Clostridium botulinum]APR02411.1 hypothetical protein RSJ2_4176 [Clostridium botulinum]MBN3359395.1 hypothetical protein [Clostridium botulinum]MBN3367223.1 hypothetical protein [Clostridium botulinum]MBN3371607.1 hypothetical protein [Clostridium botulinum]MBN3376552.1 hypothetical protein [Clostridium botulinum]